MKVSVAIPSYKFSSYIEECLESVLAQKTSFNFEIVVRDDFSNDGTSEILKKYSDLYSNIKLLPSNKNLGFHRNIKSIFENCSGEYIAYLDGDDYWCDKDKLQKQSDFLDENQIYSMVFGGYYVQEGMDKSTKTDYWFGTPPEVKGDLGPDNFIWGNAVNSLTKMFRNYREIFKDYFFDMSLVDWPLNLEISKNGPIKFINEPYGVYRRHSTSLSLLDNGDDVYNKNRKYILENLIK